jgi:hypothetical protein
VAAVVEIAMEAASVRKAVWFYNLELALLADGGYHVSLTATTVDEDEPQLLCQELLNEPAHSIDDALALIKQAISGTTLCHPRVTRQSPA